MSHRLPGCRSALALSALLAVAGPACADGWPGNHLTPLRPESGLMPNWTTFQGNSAHTGRVPVSLDAAKFSSRWQIPVQSVPRGFLPGVAAIAIAHGMVYVSGGTSLAVYREVDGSPVWSHDFSDLQFPSVNPPAVSKGVVYVAAGQQSSTSMYAFDAVSGAQVFQGAMSSQWENYLAPTMGPHGVYSNAGEYGGLYGFSRSGRQRFFAEENQQSFWTPAVDGSGVYSYTGFLQVVDPVSGAVTHSIQDPSFSNYVYEIGGSPVLGAPGSVFVANYANAQLNGGAIGNSLLDFSVATDSIAWSVAGAYPTTPAYAAGTVYAANNVPFQLEARAEAGGGLSWKWAAPAGDGGFVSEVLLTENLAFVSTLVATYAVDLQSHQTVWRYPLSGKLALSKAGVLYIQGASTLSAFNVM